MRRAMVQYHGMREAQRTGSQSIVRGERRSRCPPSTGGRGSCGILSRRHRNCRGTHLKNSSGLRWNIQPPSSVKSSCFKALFNWRYTAAASDGLFCQGKKGVLHDGKKLDGSIILNNMITQLDGDMVRTETVLPNGKTLYAEINIRENKTFYCRGKHP